MKEETEDIIQNAESLARNIQDKLLFIRNFLGSIVMHSADDYNYAKIEVNEQMLKKAQQELHEYGKNIMRAELQRAFCIPENDLNVIYNNITDILTESRDLLGLIEE